MHKIKKVSIEVTLFQSDILLKRVLLNKILN